MDASTVEALKAKYPDKELLLLSGAGYEVVAKSPGKAEMDMFRDLTFNEKTRSRGMERLLRACLVHPGQEELGVILNSKPALVEKWADKLLESGGAAEEVEAKKL